MKFLLIIFMILFSISNGWSKDITVMILGGMPSSWEEQDFGQTTLYLTRAAEKRGEQIIVGAPFQMKFINGKNPGLTYFNVDDAKEVKNLVKKINKITEPGDRVNLLVYGHGNPTRFESNPDKTSIQLGDERIKTNALVKIFNKNLSKDVGIKAIAPYCFSGSIHKMSHSRDNSCSAAASDFRTPSKGERDCFFGSCQAISSYGMKISKIIYENPNISLAKAHELVSENDYLNKRLGNLSSIDYIQRIFKKGPYKDDQNIFQELFSNGPKQSRPKKYISEVCPELKNAFELSQEKLDFLVEDTKSLLKFIKMRELFHPAVPSFVVDSYRDHFERYKDNFEKIESELGQIYGVVKSQMHGFKEIERSGGFINYSDRIALSSFKQELDHKMNELLRYKIFEDRTWLINLLYRKGTKEQIQKFEDLAQCEID